MPGKRLGGSPPCTAGAKAELPGPVAASIPRMLALAPRPAERVSYTMPAGVTVNDITNLTADAVSWSPAVGGRRDSRLRPLSVMLLCGAALSQIGILIFTFAEQRTDVAAETLGIAGLLVALAVTWYAVNLRASAFGGALVLGWSTVIALQLLAAMSPWTAIGVLGCVLLAAVMILALIYMRDQRPLGPSRWPSGASISVEDL